ncbi:MAG: ABC transporter ATP-binding protein, partial [Bdellovibrionaceae bacterium]|nr:ABC transporter ATP-binding protein [Pseudobdellovibrionaceae bacterium]
GGLLSRTLNDTLIIQQGLNQYIDLLREPFIALISLGFMFAVNYKLTLVCLIFAPIVAFVIRKVSKTLRSLTSSSQESLDSITKSLKETIDGVRIIHAYNLEDYVRSQFRVKIDRFNWIRKKVAKRYESTRPINEFLASIVIGGLCLFVGEMALRGEADLTTFTMFIALAANLEKPIKKIQQSIIGSQQTEVSIARVFEIIENTDVVKELPAAEQKPFPKNWSTIQFKNINFSYKDQPVLKNLNLTIKRGESIALVGESGAGKSTLVNLFERFIDPTSGGIFIDDVNTQEISLKNLRNQIAYVSQDTFLFDETVEENIRLGENKKPHELVVEAAQKANALKFIERLPLGFKSFTGERGANFSGGEKQRLSIARAIFKDADILILDEATSALDSGSEAEVQKGIASLLKNRTSLIIAHRLSTIQSSDRIIVMDKGEIVEQGTHEELLKLDKMYTRYHRLQEMNSKST